MRYESSLNLNSDERSNIRIFLKKFNLMLDRCNKIPNLRLIIY